MQNDDFLNQSLKGPPLRHSAAVFSRQDERQHLRSGGEKMTLAKIITIQIEHLESGLIAATSDDVKGLFAVAEDLDTLKENTRQQLQMLFEVRGHNVLAIETEGNDTQAPPPWVVLSKADLCDIQMSA
ncbi:MAG: hypothetical protein AAFY65_01175 [Pseudomonadota bacterium]